jgi:hypothetical protein
MTRSAIKRTSVYPAWIECNGALPHKCEVEGISAAGARVHLTKDITSDYFVLRLAGSGTLRRRCNVIGRKELMVDVVFEASPCNQART